MQTLWASPEGWREGEGTQQGHPAYGNDKEDSPGMRAGAGAHHPDGAPQQLHNVAPWGTAEQAACGGLGEAYPFFSFWSL